MAYRVQTDIGLRMRPAAIAGTGNQQTYGPDDSQHILNGLGDTVAQIIVTPDDFVAGSGTKPQLALDLDNGTDPEIVPAVTLGGGGEDIGYAIIEQVAGTANDFDLVRAISIRASANVAGAAKIKALVTLGDLSTDTWERQCHQIGFDSTLTDHTSAGLSLTLLPQGHTHAAAHTLKVIIYEATNAKLIITIAGK